MDLTPGQKSLLPWWGNIQQAVATRATTAQLWDAVRTSAASEGVVLRGVSGADMSVLRGVAASQRNAMEAFGRLRPNEAITGDLFGRDISSRDLGAQALAPAWLVRFEHDVTVDGELRTFWRTSTFEGALPATAGSLRSAVETDAEQMALSGSGGLTAESVTHVGVGQIQIVAV